MSIIHQKEPIRLFKSDFLEFFSHIKPWVVLVVYIPFSCFLITRAVIRFSAAGISSLWMLPAMVGGWVAWTFIEYTLHRFLFHYHPKSERFKRIFFFTHGVHHTQPMCKTRLVMPPVISLPIALFFYIVYWCLFSVVLRQPLWLLPVFSGSVLGYVIYDMVHYILHHAKLKKGYLAMCRRQHMRHHVTCPNMRFGVSMPLWDYVFGTMPPSGLSATLKKRSGSSKWRTTWRTTRLTT